MTKKTLNQNAKNVQKLIQTIEPDFIFSSKTINRFKLAEKISENKNQNKSEKLLDLKNKINSIQNCNLKENSKNFILGDGNINSPIMLIGEAPGAEEDVSSLAFQGEIGKLLSHSTRAHEHVAGNDGLEIDQSERARRLEKYLFGRDGDGPEGDAGRGGHARGGSSRARTASGVRDEPRRVERE